MNRLRFCFTKQGKVRFTSHRDVARLWERALRRVELPVAYSQGFSPRLKMHFGLALPTGYESLGEYIDVDLDPEAEIVGLDVATSARGQELLERLTDALPIGIECTAAGVVAPGTPSLQEAVTSCTWRIGVGCPDQTPGSSVAAAVERVLAATELPIVRERKGKQTTDDLRPAIHDLVVVEAGPSHAELIAELGTQPRAARPSELLAVLDPTLEERLVVRLHQCTSPDGAQREEPLSAGATQAPHAQARAS